MDLVPNPKLMRINTKSPKFYECSNSIYNRVIYKTKQNEIMDLVPNPKLMRINTKSLKFYECSNSIYNRVVSDY